jgi:hypothetical protein
MPSVEGLISITERVEAKYMSWPGVTGVDVGGGEVSGERADPIATLGMQPKANEVAGDHRVPEQPEAIGLKNVNDGWTTFIKDMEVSKELGKDKALRTDIVREPGKDAPPVTTSFEELCDSPQRRLGCDVPVFDRGDPAPLHPAVPGGQSVLERRLAALETLLG